MMWMAEVHVECDEFVQRHSTVRAQFQNRRKCDICDAWNQSGQRRDPESPVPQRQYVAARDGQRLIAAAAIDICKSVPRDQRYPQSHARQRMVEMKQASQSNADAAGDTAPRDPQ